MTEAFLNNILESTHRRLQGKKDLYYALKWKSPQNARPHVFRDALAEPGQIKLIAEIKKASPSKGLIREDFDPVAIAKIYEENHATAISILTEEKYFQGKTEYVKQVSDVVRIPILVKDFIITSGQIYEACANGASAVLLIVAILDDAMLKDLIATASSLGLDCLVEVHTETELTRAVKAGAEIIGVNNRDLFVFNVDMRTCEQIIPKIPKGKIIVGESGYTQYSEVRALKAMGAHGVLIGETFMRSQNIAKKIKDVLYGAH
jgi:indole-3-glycerol phosphate synthase